MRGAAEGIPFWAPRVSKAKIRRFYENDAKGVYDEDLIDDVGYGLLARCESFIGANEAAAGNALCPRCSAKVPHQRGKDEILRCECGWELPWKDYFRTFQHKQLSGAEPVLKQFQEFVKGFPAARTSREKVLLIDKLIHGFHWFSKTNGPTRPVAVNLIEGRLGDVVAFLEKLTYSENSTAGTAENLAEWNRNIEVNREWYPSRRHGRELPSEPEDGENVRA
jgi:hypothetical protein